MRQRLDRAASAANGALVHVAVRWMRRQVAFVMVRLVTVVAEPHVVAKFMREDNAATVEQGDAERAGEVCFSANVVVGEVDDQMHEVGAGPVAQGVRLVQVAVVRIIETADIDVAGRFGVPHLGPADQRQAVVHPARRVGLVGLGDQQVDLRLDRGGAAARRPRARRAYR